MGRHPQALCRRATGAPARLHRRQIQLQQRRRPLPHLRRQRLRARGNAVSERRVSALPRLQRSPLAARSAGSDDRAPRAQPGHGCRPGRRRRTPGRSGQRQARPRPRRPRAERGRRAGTHRGRSRAAFCARPRRHPRPATADGCGAGLREAGPARAHAQRRRGAAPETGGPPGRSRANSQPVAPARGQKRHAVSV